MIKYVSFVIIMGFSLLIPSGPVLGNRVSHSQDEIRFTPPPGEESAEIKSVIDELQVSLEKKELDSSKLLSEFIYLRLHSWPRFRELIRSHATSSATIVTPLEPGTRMVVKGTIRDKQGAPIKGALLYVYQTSDKGWYSDKAPHISGIAGDEKFARLFGYLKTGADGSYEFRTIRPSGYPHSNLPAHIHVEIETTEKESRTLITEIQFEDDSRLTNEMRGRASREHLKIFPVKREADGSQSVRADFQL